MSESYLDSLLGEREKIVLTARQHWFILVSSILLEIFLILLVFALTVTAAVFLPQFLAIVILIGFAILLLPLATMTRDILNWTNHQYVITNRRVIQIMGVINKSVIDSSLEKVNDVKMVQSAMGRMFNYGDIEILTASEMGVNLFKRIEDPVRFKTAMLDAKDRLEHGEMPAQPQPGDDVPAMIAQLDHLRRAGVLTDEEFQVKKAQLLAKI
jgi:uncharacterized membrane protein YdbT with pleckstrin-like domain